MLARTVSRASRLRTSRAVNPQLLLRYHNGQESSRMASSFGSWNSEPLTATKRPRISIVRMLSTPAAAAAPDASLPTKATTGAIASHKAPIPTERDIAMAGGVFSLTSAKRDKLGEFKGQLKDEHWSLDDMATSDERLDLHLADGIMLVTKTTDFAKDNDQLKELSEWLDDDQEGGSIDRTTLGIRLEAVRAKVEGLLETVPSDRCLRNVRDFLDPTDLSEILKDYNGNDFDDTALNPESSHFWDSVTRYRLLLTKSAIDHVLDSWEMFTTVSDMDVDRAAAEGISLESELDTVDGDKILGLLQACMTKSCSERITATWNLMDRDEDGSLDQDEMHKVVHLCLAIEVDAVKQLFEESLDAYPVRAPLNDLTTTTTSGEEDTPQPKKGWRQRRAEEKVKKNLSKMFIKSCSKHFDIEVEIDHRLRCIYAWANKADQDNQVKSVVVGEQAGWSGRQRYVELSPKISEAEFREVQCLHFKHADKFGSEILGSFREDLWVLQGRRRERKDLYKNSFLFLAGVSAVDYAILCL
mmetsp:Transcript_20945/g.51948  ORF Transcript_20945/g.51948 Transcript_20945/m.51948 type:complete len:528 (+) Transcript_20945:150-1733(+)